MTKPIPFGMDRLRVQAIPAALLHRRAAAAAPSYSGIAYPFVRG
ncbi:hypothetical protein [Polaromonas sp. OV174]|nr:hypothetical protein [Polaromonas sp. OV174]